MKLHPVTSLFPSMADAEFQALVADIKQHGQREPIWVYRGEIIDGAHRSRACEVLRIPVRSQEWDGKGSLVAFAISQNLKRRHLTQSQKAMIATDALPMFEAEAKERQRASGHRGGVVPARLPEPLKGEAREQAAAAVGVSPRYVQDAKRIANQRPDLAQEVRAGTKTLPQAIAQVEPAARARRESATHPELKRRPRRKSRDEQFARTVTQLEVHVANLTDILSDVSEDNAADWAKRLAVVRRDLSTVVHQLERMGVAA